MTRSDANTAFLVDTYRGVTAALRASDDCLREYLEQSVEGRQTLHGSLLTVDGSWGYVPFESGAVRYSEDASKVLVRMADGSAARAIPIKEFGNGKVTGIMPAVLSSHLDGSRRLQESTYAAHVRARDGDPNEKLRVVVEKLQDSTMVLKTAAVTNPGVWRNGVIGPSSRLGGPT